MKILAFADLHGRWWQEASRLVDEHEPDWIVLLGDMLPDFDQVAGIHHRAECQRRFVEQHGNAFLRAGIPTHAIRGNHEAEGWEIPVAWQRVPPTVASLAVIWEQAESERHPPPGSNGEAAPIVLSHWPPEGCLDGAEDGPRIGDPHLRAWLEALERPGGGLVLCGHVHEGFGLGRCGEALVVNAAEGYALLETTATGRWQVVRMERMETVRANRDLDEIRD